MVVSTVSFHSMHMYFLIVGICLTFFANVGFSLLDWQDTSSCKYDNALCSANNHDGYLCADGETCLNCDVLLYNYDCNKCDCDIGSLAFILICIAMFLLIIGSIICCWKFCPCCKNTKY